MYLLLQSLKENLSIESASYILVGLDGGISLSSIYRTISNIISYITITKEQGAESITKPQKHSILIFKISRKQRFYYYLYIRIRPTTKALNTSRTIRIRVISKLYTRL